jgi:hypothetical protein
MSIHPLSAFAGSFILCVLAIGLDARAQGISAPPQSGAREPSLSSRRFVLGERPFSPASSWNTPIAASATYSPLNWPAGARFGVAWEGYSPAVYVSSAADPLVSISHPPTWGHKGGMVRVRIPPAGDGAVGTDGELLVIDDGIVHNFYQFKRLTATTATAAAYGATNVVTGTGWGRASPVLGAGIVATGSSQLAGLLVQAETDRGEIAHALQVCIEDRLAIPGHSGEAIGGDGQNPQGIVQEGVRLAIPRQSAMPRGLSPLGQQVFRAYQEYGAFVIDVAGGVTNLRAQANAYDVATIKALSKDLPRITPMLQRVR